MLFFVMLIDHQSDHIYHGESDAQKSSNHKTDGAAAGIVAEKGIGKHRSHAQKGNDASGLGIHKVTSRISG
jgi:hypothetical protein